jgi:hypothetical protein
MKGLRQSVVVVLCLITAMVLLQPIRGRASAQATPAGDDASALLRQQPLGLLLGKQVLVIPTGREPEQGKLEAYDANWVRLRTQDGNVRCYSAANVLFIANSEAAPKP